MTTTTRRRFLDQLAILPALAASGVGYAGIATDGARKMINNSKTVRELRTAMTVQDYARAVAFYRDSLGLSELQSWNESYGSGMILNAGRATLELLSAEMAAYVDHVEVGRRVAGPVRLALQVEDSVATAKRLVASGAVELAAPVVTPWKDRNVRIQAPDGMQMTIFTTLP
jgi:catechol 2,3-dioxygenase-like lactoylglutathione lyase family enzyme